MVMVLLFVTFTIGSAAENGTDTKEYDKLYLQQRQSKWFSAGEELIKKNLKEKQINKKAKGVILFLGDGMGVPTVTTARILDGQLKGKTGEENELNWESFPNVAFSKTYNTDSQVPDSAGTATAFLTGVKSYSGAIGVSETLERGECSNRTKENHLLSILELAELSGLSTGVVTTTRVTHATPAATYAHATDRHFESDADIPKGCGDVKDIARQLIEFPYGNGIEVVLGGGKRNFVPQSEGGKRKDGRNLIKEWSSKSDGKQKFEFAGNRSQLKGLDPEQVDHVLGLFNPSHMKFAYNRNETNTKEPSLIEMTEFAIKVLQKNSKGYFLLVEGGRIDHAHHLSKAFHALHDTVEMNKAVDKAKQLTSADETLILVTADHSHTFSMSGYGPRGNNIFGFASEVDKNGKKYTTLGYYNGPGAKDERVEPRKSELEDPEFVWQSLVPLSMETHGGEDVGVYAQGPQAHLIRGVVEQNYIFHVMDYALCLSEGKKNICSKEGLINSRVRTER